MFAIYCGEATEYPFEPNCETDEELPREALNAWLEATRTEDNETEEEWDLASSNSPTGEQMVVWATPYRGEQVTLVFDL